MSTANITVTANEPVITVSNDLANVSVTTAISNVVVGEATFAGNADIRAALSGGTGVTYNSTTGVIAIGQAVAASDTVDFSGLQVKDSNDAGEIQIGSTVGGTSNQGQLRLTAGSPYATGITSYGNLTIGTVNPTGVGFMPKVFITTETESVANISTTANVSGAYILGDGSQLTGINHLTNAQAKTYIEGTGLDATANLNTTANASATYFIGDGSQLTGVDSNADVKAFIESTGLAMTSAITSNSNITTSATMHTTNLESQGALDIKFNADGSSSAANTFSISNSGGPLTRTFQLGLGTTNYFRVGSDSTGDGQTQTGSIKVYGDSSSANQESIVVDAGNIVVSSGNVSAAGLVTTGNATVGANLMVAGNLEVTGNINYREVEDLLVQDQTITLNFGNASAQDAQIIVDRQGSGVANVDLKWNETADKWQFTNDGSTYNDMLTNASAQAYIETNGLDLTSNITTTAAILTNDLYANPKSGNLIIGGASHDAENIDIRMNGNFGITQNRTGSHEPVLTADALSGNTVISIKSSTAYPQFSNFKMLGNVGGSSGMFTVDTDGNVTAAGNISGSYILGDGSQLTNLPTQGDITEVIAGIGLSGGGTTGAVTVNLDPTVTTTTASGGGALAYDNTSGVFTFTPADPPSPSAIINNTSNVSIPQPGGNITMAVGNAPVVDIGTTGAAAPAEFTVQGNITAVSNVSASYFIGDGSALTNLPTQANLDTGNVYVGNANVTVQVTPSTNFVTQITTSGSTAGAITEIIPNLNQGPQPSNNADSIAITGLTGSGNNATAVTIAGVTDTGATQVNGNTYYIKWDSAQNLYGLYTDVGLLTPVQVMTATGYIGSPGGSPTATYSAGTIITPTFALADTVTVANVQLTNELQSSAGANLNINSNTKNVVFKKDFQSATDTAQIEIDPEGWAVSRMTTAPTYSGTAERVAYVLEGSATLGSNVITVTAAETFQAAYGTNNWNGTAPSTGGRTTMFTGANPIAAGYVPKTKGSESNSQSPFPSGSIIQSIDTVANTITMSQPALSNYTFAWSGGGNDQDTYFLCAGAYNEQVGVGFVYFSNFDFANLGAPDSSKVTIQSAEVASQDRYGFGQTGPSIADLTYSIGTSSDYTKPTYATRGRMSLNGETSFLNTNYGLGIGKNVSVTNRITNDVFPAFGYAQLWDGTETYSSEFGVSSPFSQIGTKQYTDGSAQASQPHLGTRLQFMSAYGKVTDPSNTWYPRSGQELGRIGFWGSHGNLEQPSSTSQPAYISVQAADNWTTGSNASVYHVATSDNNNQYRMPFMSFEKGNLILASGLNAGSQESVHFAPGRGVTNNPATVYDFNAGATGTAGWASINYKNVGGNTGSELSVNNGGSSGAGNVGDMTVSVHRKDNSYSGNIIVAPGAGGAYPSQSGMPGDLYTTPSGSPLRSIATGTAVTIQGQTDSLLTPLNGTVAYAKVYYGAYVVLFTDPGTADVDAISLLAAGGSSGAATASVTFEYASSSASGVTDRKWELDLAEQSEALVIKTTNAVPSTSSVMTFKESEILANKQMRSDITDKGTTFVSGNTIALGATDLNTITAGITTSGAGTVTVDVSALGVAATGGIWKVEITNSSGAAQTIATSNAVTNVSQSVANGGKILLVLHSVGTTVYAGYFV